VMRWYGGPQLACPYFHNRKLLECKAKIFKAKSYFFSKFDYKDGNNYMIRKFIISTRYQILAESRSMRWTRQRVLTMETGTYTKMILEIRDPRRGR
jgi:hypothetical protein